MNDHRVTTDGLPEFLRIHADLDFSLLGEGPNRLVLDAGHDPFVAHGTDMVVDVDVGLPLEVARERCTRAGFLLPLPAGAETVLEALLRSPGLADAWVRDFDGVDRLGARSASPVSPRAAVGPDPMGGALLRSLLLLPRRVRLRVVSIGRSRVARDEVEDASEAATRVLDAMARGRAFIVGAVASEVRLTEGTSATTASAAAAPAMSPLPSGPSRRGRALAGASHADLEDILTTGALLVGAPQQGRLVALDEVSPASVTFPPVDAAADHLREALVACAAQAAYEESADA